MITVKISGGLGNQLFQYAIGRSIAIKLGCELLLDTSFYSSQILRNYELDKFCIKARVATKSELSHIISGDNTLYKIIKKLKLNSLLYPNYIIEKESVRYLKAIDQCKVGTYLDGYWQNPAYFSSYRKSLLADIVPSKPLSLEAQNWIAKISNTNSVSLHVRRGDYINNKHTNSIHGVCPIDYYENAINYINSKVENTKFFVFSDDIEWCNDNLPKSELFYFIDNTICPIDDLILMANCHHNIIANSTFSWWGAWLGDNGIVIAPKKWFSSDERNSVDIYPDDWIVL